MFDKFIQKLKERGWIFAYDYDSEGVFVYRKSHWRCVLDGPANTITFCS